MGRTGNGGAKPQAKWQNRIVGEGHEVPSQLLANPANWRIHTHEQEQALATVLDRVGWVQRIIVNKATGHMIDGHLRVALAISRNEPSVPVTYVELAPEEEALTLATFDTTGAMAGTDSEKLADLLRELPNMGAEVDALIGRLPVNALLPPDGVGVTASQQPNDAALFGTANQWELPELLPDMLWDGHPPGGVWVPGEPETGNMLYLYHANKHANKDFLAFYIGDDRIGNLWEDATKKIEEFRQYAAVVSPDCSMWRDDPIPVLLWAVYRSRWCSRMWQEHGIKCIPSLNWGGPKTYAFAFEGIPSNAPIVSCQCRTLGDGTSRGAFVAGLKEAVSRLQPQHVIIYGGQEHKQWLTAYLPEGPRWTLLDSWTKKRFKHRKEA